MKTSGKSREQLKDEALLPDGIYAFEVLSAEEQTSKKGNDMIVLALGIYDAANNVRRVTDYLVAGSNLGEQKIQSFAEAVGLLEEYTAGDIIASDCFRKTGFAKIVKQESEQYGPKNVVRFYVPELPADVKPTVAPAREVPAATAADDDIPF